MNKIIGILLGVSVLFGVLYAPVLAQTTTSTSSAQELLQSLQQLIEKLKAQIESLKTQIESLKQARLEVKQTEKEIKVTLKLIRQLRFGMTGEDIKLLQETLATDPDVYPEGLVTGYFGPLTRNAVKRFQKIAGIEQVGMVGPKTLSRINELLEVGVGESGKVPPGLLIAPGIRKKLGFEPKPLPGQELPPGIAKKLGEEVPADDTTPPIISSVSAIDTTSSSTMITWVTDEPADSKVWYDTSTPLVIPDSTPMVSFPDLVLNHEIALFSLTLNTTYYYLAVSTDAVGNATSSDEETFTTLSE